MNTENSSKLVKLEFQRTTQVRGCERLSLECLSEQNEHKASSPTSPLSHHLSVLLDYTGEVANSESSTGSPLLLK